MSSPVLTLRVPNVHVAFATINTITILCQNDDTTVVPTKSGSDVVFCLQLQSKSDLSVISR